MKFLTILQQQILSNVTKKWGFHIILDDNIIILIIIRIIFSQHMVHYCTHIQG